MPTIHKIFPCLWFDDQAEDAAKFYTSIFDGSRITQVTHYTEEGHEIHGRKVGSVMTVAFDLQGTPFTALNGGPHFKFTEAVSLQVMCDTQEELDGYWTKLSTGGDEKAQQCGWLKDKYGLSWQIVPSRMPEWVKDGDPARSSRVMKAMLKMKKLDIAALKKAAAG